MRLFRSTFFVLIVSLCVLAGYTLTLSGHCCAHEKQKQEQLAKLPSGKDLGENGHGCQCLCHQVFSNLGLHSAELLGCYVDPEVLRANAGEFPPDMVPAGIEYPPQLA